MLLDGAIDLHVHSGPDVVARSLDDFGLAEAAAAAGMRGLLLKNHHTLTADRAALVASRTSVEVFGGLVLNHSVGGLNPWAVEQAIAFGAKEIWLPTLDAVRPAAVVEDEPFVGGRGGVPGIALLDDRGEPVPALRPILEMVRDAGVILGTGHLSPAESLAVLRHARALGVRRLLVTHPLMRFCRFSSEQMQAAIDEGALLELCALETLPTWPGALSVGEVAAVIERVGHRNCVLATDGGQASHEPAPEMLRSFASALRSEGIPETALHIMMCETPAMLLGLPTR